MERDREEVHINMEREGEEVLNISDALQNSTRKRGKRRHYF
jgi:hypothetical protein